MSHDYSIARWTRRVPGKQWAREDGRAGELGEEVPEWILESPPLAHVHRLDLALFVVFEEVALRVSGALTRCAPDPDGLNFAAQQTLDEARHLEVFAGRLERSRAAAGISGGDPTEAILIPPLRRFVERCYEVADGGSFVEGLALVTLVMEGLAYPLYAYEERYWKPVDPFMAALIRGAFVDETRHVHMGADLVRRHVSGDPSLRARVRRTCSEARALLDEVFGYYVKTFVRTFDAVARRHGDLFAGAELAPGKSIVETPYEEQVRTIQASISREHGALMESAGLA